MISRPTALAFLDELEKLAAEESVDRLYTRAMGKGSRTGDAEKVANIVRVPMRPVVTSASRAPLRPAVAQGFAGELGQIASDPSAIAQNAGGIRAHIQNFLRQQGLPTNTPHVVMSGSGLSLLQGQQGVLRPRFGDVDLYVPRLHYGRVDVPAGVAGTRPVDAWSTPDQGFFGLGQRALARARMVHGVPVADPGTQLELKRVLMGFRSKPQDAIDHANLQKVVTASAKTGKRPEHAPGLPSKKKTSPIPKVEVPLKAELVLQAHPAQKAGQHTDVRLILGNIAHSWATRKAWPGPGERIRLYQQPDHTPDYARNYRGHILQGYGRTKPGSKGVEKTLHEKIEVMRTTDRLVRFNLGDGEKLQKFVLVKLKEREGEKPRAHPTWTLINVTRPAEGENGPGNPP